MSKEFLIQINEIADHRRLEFVVQSIGNLEIGESIVILEKEDPHNLVLQVERFYEDDCLIEYLDQGPSDWKVRFVRQKPQGCCGCCNN